jgi:hypothetical protein
MNNTLQTPKPVQAGDYGKPIPEKLPMTDKAETSNTDGRKTLALWSS